MFSNLSVKDLKIFSTTPASVNASPFRLSLFATVCTCVMYSDTDSVSFIFILSSSPRRVCKRTCLTLSAPLNALSRVSHAAFDVVEPTIFSKADSSTTLNNMYNVVLSFDRVSFNALFWDVVYPVVLVGSTNPSFVTSHTSRDL